MHTNRPSCRQALKLTLLCAFLLPLIFGLASCASGMAYGGMATSVSQAYDSEADMKMMLEEQASGSVGVADDGVRAQATVNQAQAPSDQAPSNQQPSRLKIYTGYLKVEVDDVTKRKAEVLEWVTQVGGYVEASYGNRMELRVPIASFPAAMEWLAGIGKLLDRSIRSTDVTDAFADLEARQLFLQRTLDKLNALLAKATKTEEQLLILQEIRRVTDELDEIKLALQTMANAIRLSRISLDLSPRLQQQESQKRIPFPWIAQLNPAYSSLYELKGSVDVKLSADWAVFSRSTQYYAESSDLVQLRIASTKNDPLGDEVFWQKALAFHVSTQYKNAELLDLGEFKAVLFTSKDTTPFSWLVGVQVLGDTLYVAEALFPNPEAFAARAEEIKRALEAAVIR